MACCIRQAEYVDLAPARGDPVRMQHGPAIGSAVHRELVRRADLAGMTLRTYVIDVLHRHTALPNLDTWLDEVRADSPLPADGPDSVTLIEQGRSDNDAA